MNRLALLQRKLNLKNKDIVSLFGVSARSILRYRAQKDEKNLEFVIECLLSSEENRPVNLDNLAKSDKVKAIVLAVKSSLTGEPVSIEELKSNVVQE